MQRSNGLGAVPIAFTLAVLAAAAAAWLLAIGERIGAGAAVAASGAALAWSDRMLRTDPRARWGFLGTLLERAAESAPLATLAWLLLPTRAGAVAVVALSASFVAAYVHVKAVGLGFAPAGHPALQPLRMGAVAAGLLFGATEAGLWASTAVSLVSLAVASVAVARQEEPA